jgi:hypothetical protein
MPEKTVKRRLQDCDAALASEGSLRALTCVEERGDPCSAAVLPAPADQWISGLPRSRVPWRSCNPRLQIQVNSNCRYRFLNCQTTASCYSLRR